MPRSREPRRTVALPPTSAITSGTPWFDTDGTRIEAHGGGIMFHGGTYFWFGENKTNGPHNHVGVGCYSSKDLLHWRNEGIALRAQDMPERFRAPGVCERPKVIRNPRTGLFVMWMHLDADVYSAREAGVAVAQTPTGPYRLVSHMRPIAYPEAFAKEDRLFQKSQGSTFADMNLFVDDDGAAYVFYASEGNPTMYVSRLNAEFTDVVRPPVLGQTWARILIGLEREAPAPFKHAGRYYLLSSGCTGWAPNPALLASSQHILGPWAEAGDPCRGPESSTTFRSQSTCVLAAPGKPSGSFIYMGDRWNGQVLVESSYVWLPFVMGSEGAMGLEYISSWDLSAFDRRKAPLATPVVGVSGRNADGRRVDTLTWKAVDGATAYRVLRNGEYVATTVSPSYRIPPMLAGSAFAWVVIAFRISGQTSAPSKACVVDTGRPVSCYLSDVEYCSWEQGYGNLGRDSNVLGGPIAINGRVYKRGLATHAHSRVVYRLCGGYRYFKATVGLDDSHRGGSVEFVVRADGRELARTGIVHSGDRPRDMQVRVGGCAELELIVTDGGDGTHNDHANWANARLLV